MPCARWVAPKPASVGRAAKIPVGGPGRISSDRRLVERPFSEQDCSFNAHPRWSGPCRRYRGQPHGRSGDLCPAREASGNPARHTLPRPRRGLAPRVNATTGSNDLSIRSHALRSGSERPRPAPQVSESGSVSCTRWCRIRLSREPWKNSKFPLQQLDVYLSSHAGLGRLDELVT